MTASSFSSKSPTGSTRPSSVIAADATKSPGRDTRKTFDARTNKNARPKDGPRTSRQVGATLRPVQCDARKRSLGTLAYAALTEVHRSGTARGKANAAAFQDWR